MRSASAEGARPRLGYGGAVAGLRSVVVFACVLLGAAGCPEADSVELGGACTQEVECKPPADTCMTLGADTLCTLACSAESPCPESFVCARMDVRVEGADGGGKAAAQGYCLAQSRVGSHVATIAPAGEKKKKRRKRKKNERK